MKERAIAAATDRRYNFMTMATASQIKIEKLFISPGHNFFGHHEQPPGEHPTIKVKEVEGVRFAGTAECSPCHWMDEAIAPGAEAALHGRGGLRARILTGGLLSVNK